MKMNEMIVNLRHIGIIVKDARKSLALFKDLFDLEDDDIRIVSSTDTKGETEFVFVPVGGIDLELIQPISEHFREMVGNPVEGINHFAFTIF